MIGAGLVAARLHGLRLPFFVCLAACCSLRARHFFRIVEGKKTFVCLDDFKIKGHDPIEEDLVCREVGSVLRRIV